ncbi:MT-A70 family protein [Roseibium sp. TrichSKD4]|uniref:ParB N-terminal domain-containing protein n=1 Tax=Roseibium sp. TrichSKD4 TaxID=744980 RepID=UPI0001E57621|nr:ParB N-terminal domain-containing protein [Roseibium sp. TrichSKD4]EFO30968.1 MT-A70 family protein [Roseibium sp. TrichSKD4]
MTDKKIELRLIDVLDGRSRDVDPDWAEFISVSFKEHGQLTPIDVVQRDKRFELVTGAHRLAAAKLCKWKEIDARVLSPELGENPHELRRREILENLARLDFNALERCEALFDLKRIYETLHPDTKHGGKRGNQHIGGQKRQVAIFSFCQNASEKTGLSDRSIRLAITIYNALSPATRERLKNTKFAEKQSDLKLLGECKPDEQDKILNILFAEEPEAGTVGDAIALVRTGKAERPTEKIYKSILDKLPRLPLTNRREIYRSNKAEIMALADEEGWFNGR